MRISLTRFCPKNRNINTISFNELRQKQNAPIWEKTPSYIQLQESNDVILYRYQTSDGTFVILQSGFVHITYNNGTKHTVVPTTRSYTLYQDDKPIPRHISIADFLPLPFANVLAILLDLRIEINNSSRSRYHEPNIIDNSGEHHTKKEKISTKLTYSPPTMIDKLLDHLYPETTVDYQQKLYDAMSKLTELQKSVILQYYYENKTEEVIAKQLKTTRSNVQSHRRNALKKLKKYILK